MPPPPRLRSTPRCPLCLLALEIWSCLPLRPPRPLMLTLIWEELYRTAPARATCRAHRRCNIPSMALPLMLVARRITVTAPEGRTSSTRLIWPARTSSPTISSTSSSTNSTTLVVTPALLMGILIKAAALGKATKRTRATHRLRRSIPTSRPHPGAVLAPTEHIRLHMALILRIPRREAPRPRSSTARVLLPTAPHLRPLGSSASAVETTPPVAIPTVLHRPCHRARTPILNRRHSRTAHHQHLRARPLLLPLLRRLRQRRRTMVLRVVGYSEDYVRAYWLDGIPMLTTPMTISVSFLT